MTSQQDVKLKVVNTSIVKRILVPQSFAALREQASALVQNKAVKITYIDSDGDNVEVVDESDLKIAFQYAQKIIFLVTPFDQPEPKLQMQAQVQMIDTTSKQQPAVEEQAVGKKCKKQTTGNKGMNRKALKNLIQQELQSQSKDIFKEILQTPVIEGLSLEEESKEVPSKALIVHQKVSCDGCEVCPIVGIRYKCAVCKDFDFCSNCEERLAHEHPFLKIRHPNNVPDVMITILPENEGSQAQPQGEQSIPFGFGGRGSRGGRGGCGKGGRGGFKKMIYNFMEQMGINVEDISKQCQEGAGEMPDCGWNKKDWKLKRVEVVSVPDHVLEACPGQMLLPSIELHNGTHWPWKAGCVLTLAQEAGADFENLPIEMVNVPVDQEVKGKTSIKMTVPLKVHDHAVASEQVREVKLAMRGPGGFQFGNVITLKLKVVMPSDYNDEVELYKLALKLADQGLGSFDECVIAVKNANCDEQAAIKVLQRKN